MKELLLLSGLGILSLVAEIINARKLIYPLVIIGLFVNIGLCVGDLGTNETVYGMLKLDNSALAFTILSSLIALIWFIVAKNYFSDETNISDHFSLVLFSLVGVFLLASYTHLSMLFLGVEILSIPVYILAGSDKRNVYSNEAAFKYFLLGAFASGFLLLGIVFIYGGVGSFYIAQIAATSMLPYGLSEPLLIAGFLLILFALAFKMSAVPFHFWAPDVYTGAPTSITAYMSTLVKIGAVAGFYRLFVGVIAVYHNYNFFESYTTILLIIALLTIIIGNVIAATQTNIKRLLAYSSIGHAGFILLGISMIRPTVFYTVWYYLLAYCIANILAFWVLIIVEKQTQSENISAFNGLAKRNPILAGTMSVGLLSMAGIPPLGGFFAKYFVLLDVIGRGYMLIAVVVILISLIGVYYYFKIIIAMFAKEPAESSTLSVGSFTKLIMILVSVFLLIIGLMPDYFLNYFF
ncbi:MAG: NADH-quinone oxidoreductase subunit N [Chitinophagales bacterium]